MKRFPNLLLNLTSIPFALAFMMGPSHRITNIFVKSTLWLSEFLIRTIFKISTAQFFYNMQWSSFTVLLCFLILFFNFSLPSVRVDPKQRDLFIGIVHMHFSAILHYFSIYLVSAYNITLFYCCYEAKIFQHNTSNVCKFWHLGTLVFSPILSRNGRNRLICVTCFHFLGFIFIVMYISVRNHYHFLSIVEVFVVFDSWFPKSESSVAASHVLLIVSFCSISFNRRFHFFSSLLFYLFRSGDIYVADSIYSCSSLVTQKGFPSFWHFAGFVAYSKGKWKTLIITFCSILPKFLQER